MQIVQELCKRPGLNRTGFDMPTIYVPSMTSGKVGIECMHSINQNRITIDLTAMLEGRFETN